MNTNARPQIFCWDIFCRVIDNLGDLGVCWRLAVQLAQRGQQVRLWADRPDALAWMAPQGAPGVQVLTWTSPIDMAQLRPGDVLVEAFGCEIPPEFVAAYAHSLKSGDKKCRWINLEYLSAEAYAERCHGLPSPVLSGPGKGLCKHFFYPGFTPGTGGLLREPDLLARRSQFDRAAWLAQQGIAWQGERLVSLFCYEPDALARLLDALATDTQPSLLLVTSGRAAHAVRHCLASKTAGTPPWNQRRTLSVAYLPPLPQDAFDQLLWACDLNFVRGEDSLVRALWAGQALVWQIYPQDDDAHHAKLEAFLDWLQAPASLRAFHQVWNGYATSTPTVAGMQEQLALAPDVWGAAVRAARERLLLQHDLVSALLQFISKNN